MTMKLPLCNGKTFITIVSTCAPTMTNLDEIKDKVYEDLNTVITTVPYADKLIILGDSNTRVCCDSTSWKGVIGRHGVGNCNSNGLLLLQTCTRYFTPEDILERVPRMFLVYGGICAVIQLVGSLLLTNPPTSLGVLSMEDEIVSSDSMKQDGCLSGSSSTKDLTAQFSVSVSEVEFHSDFCNFVGRDPPESKAVSPSDMLKEHAFYILWFVFLLSGQGMMFVISLFKAYGQTFIADDKFLAFVGTIAAGCNTASRLLCGILADRFSVKDDVSAHWRAICTTPYQKSSSQGAVSDLIAALFTSSFKSAVGWYGMFYVVAGFSFGSFILISFYNVKKPDGMDA